MFAYIKNGQVSQIIDAENVEGRYAPAFVARCVPCDETVTTGMTWDGQSFGPVPVPTRSAADIKREMDVLDRAAIRAMRAIRTGKDTPDDSVALAENEARVQALRDELAALGSEA